MTQPNNPVPLDSLLAHRAWVRTVARALVADPNSADDVEQEVWLAAVRRPPLRATSVRGWLGTVTRNVARRLRRDAGCRERHEAAAGSRPDEVSAADSIAEAELQQRIGRAVLELEEPFRSTVMLRYFDGLPPRDVAARLDVPVETVRSRLRRARERLRTRLDTEDGGSRGAWAIAVLAWDRPGIVHLARAASAGAALGTGGVIMNKVVAAAVVVLAASAATWFALHETQGSAPSSSASVVADAPTADADAAPSTRRRASPVVDVVVDAGPSDELPPPIDLDGVDRDLDLHGTVVDPSGQGIPAATIAIVGYPWRTTSVLNTRDYDAEIAGPATRTAIDGTFAVRLGRGESAALRVSAEGFAPIEYTHVLAGERMRVVLSPGVRLLVTLTDAFGAPVPDATMTVANGAYDEAGVAFDAEAMTGPDGIGVFAALPSGARARVEARHRENGVGYLWNVDLPTTGEIAKELRLAAARTVRGRVVDAATGEPIQSARVGMGWTLDQPVTTDTDGWYALPGWSSEGTRSIHVWAEGYASAAKSVDAAEAVSFELERGYAAVGRIVDADAQPVADARVSLVASPGDGPGGQLSHGYAVSDADGRFRVTSLRAGMRHIVAVAASGHARLRRVTPTAASTDDVDLGDLVLARPRRVEGVVLGDDGTPLQRQTVFLSGPDTGNRVGSFYGKSVTVATDDLGRFRFAGVEPGDYVVVVRPTGGQEIRKRVQVRPSLDVLGLRIGRAAVREVTFTVTDATGAPLSSATVAMTNTQNKSVQGRTDADGVARVAVPIDSKMTWSVHPPHDTGRTFLAPAWTPLPDDVDALQVVLEEASFVTGRMIDPDGAAVAQAWFRLVEADGTDRWTQSDAEGRFRALVRSGSRSMVVFDGAVLVGGTHQESGLTAHLEGVEAGSDVVVRCTRVDLDRTLTVVVVSPDGEPVVEASVGLSGPQGPVTRGVYPQTDTDGRIELDGLPARECTARVVLRSTEFVAPAPVTFVPSGQELRLVCRPGVRISGLVVSKDGKPRPYGMARALRDGETVAWAQVGPDGGFALLLPEDDTEPVRVVIERNNDDTPEASLGDVTPGAEGLRLVTSD